MININLLPDIKMQRVEAARRQRTIGALSTLAIGIGIALPVFMMVLWGGQKALLALTQRGIEDKIKKIQSEDDLSTILTVQNQLTALPELDKQRLFYNNLLNVLPKLIPQNASLLSIDTSEGGSVKVSGKASSLASVNDFVNILQAAKLSKGTESRPAFSNVTLTNAAPTDTGATFEVSFIFDNALVAKTIEYQLSVADRVIYQPPATTSSEENSGSAEGTTQSDQTGQSLLPQEQQ